MKRKRLALVSAGLVVVTTLVVMYWLGSTLLILGISALIAYVLLPVARLLERAMPWRRRWPGLSRGIAVAIIFLAGLGIIAGVLISVIPPTINQGRQFIVEFPTFFNAARMTIEERIADYTDLIPDNLREQAEQALSDAGGVLGRAAWTVARQTFAVISGSLAFIIGLATAPLLVFYLMKDSGKIRDSLGAPFPRALNTHLKNILDIADRTLGGYIRGQLVLGIIVGVIVGIGLLLLDVPFAFVLGVVAGLTELVPIIGPWIGGAIGVLVTLATAPEKVVWVILLYLGVQLLENSLLAPRVQSAALHLHPIAVILIITIASQYFGLWGIILGPPLVAMGKDIVVYLVEEWNQETAAAETGAVNPAPAAEPPVSSPTGGETGGV